MDRYAYADNVYNFDNPFRGASHTILAMQALKARQQQEAYQNALDAARVGMQQQELGPRMDLTRAQTEQAKAATGHSNQLVADMKRYMGLGQNAQDINAAMVGAQQFTNPETLGTLVTALRNVPGLAPQGQFDVTVPRVDMLGPSPADVGVTGFPGLPQPPNFDPLLEKLVAAGQGGMAALARSSAIGNPAAAERLVSPTLVGAGQQQRGMFGELISQGREPVDTLGAQFKQALTLQNMKQSAAERLAKHRSRLQAMNQIYAGMGAGTLTATGAAKAMGMIEKQYGGGEDEGEVQVTVEQLQREAQDVIKGGADPKAVAARYKELTGQDLVIPK